MLRDWSFITQHNAHKAILTRLLNVIVTGVDNGRVPMYVSRTLIRCVAVLLKRGWFEGVPDMEIHMKSLMESHNVTSIPPGGERRSLLWEAVACMKDTELHRIMALMLLADMALEMYGEQCTGVGMLWSYHLLCRVSFQKYDLASCCEVVFVQMSALTRVPDPLHSNASMVTALINLLHCVLTWDFASSNNPMALLSSDIQNDAPLTIDSVSWKPILIDTAMITWLFTIVRSDHESRSEALDCLRRLATVRGHIFSGIQERMMYVMHIIVGALNMLSDSLPKVSDLVSLASVWSNPTVHSATVCQSIVFDIAPLLAQVILSGVHNIKSSEILCLPLDADMTAFSNNLMLTTANVSIMAYADGINEEAQQWAVDVLPALLDIWVALLSSIESVRRYLLMHEDDVTIKAPSDAGIPDINTISLLSSCSYNIFYVYIHAQLTSHNTETPLMDDELSCIGILGRGDVVSGIRLLSSLFAVAVRVYMHSEYNLQQYNLPTNLVQTISAPASDESSIDNVVILLRMCAVVITDDCDGELPRYVLYCTVVLWLVCPWL